MNKAKLLENSTLRVTSAIAAAVFVGSLIVGEATWKANVSNDIGELKESVEAINQKLSDHENAWRKSNQREWSLETELLNKQAGNDWQAAPID